MSSVKIKLNSNGVRQLLRSSAVMAECRRYATNMQQKAGPGYAVEDRRYPERNGAAVFPATEEAYYDNLENNTLEKVVRSV